jgi:hypothetical protein
MARTIRGGGRGYIHTLAFGKWGIYAADYLFYKVFGWN